MTLVTDKIPNAYRNTKAGANAEVLEQMLEKQPKQLLWYFAVGYVLFLLVVFSLIVTVGLAIKIAF